MNFVLENIPSYYAFQNPHKSRNKLFIQKLMTIENTILSLSQLNISLQKTSCAIHLGVGKVWQEGLINVTVQLNKANWILKVGLVQSRYSIMTLTVRIVTHLLIVKARTNKYSTKTLLSFLIFYYITFFQQMSVTGVYFCLKL